MELQLSPSPSSSSSSSSMGDTTDVVVTDDETTVPENLKSSEKKALLELRTMLEDAIAAGQLLHHPSHRHERSKTRVANSCSVNSSCVKAEEAEEDLSDVSLWGVPLLPSRKHESTDVILLKFLRAREFKAAEALDMIGRTLRWRRDFGVDGMMEGEGGADAAPPQPPPPHLKSAAYIDGRDREGHPVCYNIYGVFKDKDVYRQTFGDEERQEKFLRWRVQLMEQGIKQMSLKPSGAAAMLHIIDFKDSLRPGMRELRSATREIVSIMQDNYPEFVAKNIFLNVSFRYYAYHALFSPFITPRTRSKFIFARPAKVTETLLKFMSPENIPVQYGGLRRGEDDDEFSAENERASELVIRGGGIGRIEIPILEPGVTVVWDITVVGWDVNYREEFIPEDEGSYKILIQNEKKPEECIRNSFYISEPGKVVLTVENRTFKKKRVFYRSKSKPTIPLYDLLSQTQQPQL
ncbi:patellin-4-like [Musa acuminata AAA Group]|uniref:patellin-4-like n=1 Tax=Musa acuminata AAA Group TaxID=214697 RepID=UPI0031CFBCC2